LGRRVRAIGRTAGNSEIQRRTLDIDVRTTGWAGFPFEARNFLTRAANYPVYTLIACRDLLKPNKIGGVQDFRQIQIRDEKT
jgi:hypothetical protein